MNVENLRIWTQHADRSDEWGDTNASTYINYKDARLVVDMYDILSLMPDVLRETHLDLAVQVVKILERCEDLG